MINTEVLSEDSDNACEGPCGGVGEVLGCTDRSINGAGCCAVLVRGLGRGSAMGQDSVVRTSVRSVA